MVAVNIGTPKSSSLRPGCLTVFMIPFFAAGLGAFAWGLRDVLRGDPGGWALAGFGVLFGSFAGFFYWLARRGLKRSADLAARRERFAAEPWKIRGDWAAGRIVASSKQILWFSWGFALFWNAVSCPILFAVPKELAKGKRGILVGLLFPLVGIGLVVWAIRATIRYWKYGQSVLELKTIPGAIGGILAGAIRLRQALPTREGVQLRLSCVNRVTTGSGKNRSTHHHVRWQEEQTVRKTQDLPVFFRIPADCQPTDLSNPDNDLIWRLEARASTPGVDFFTAFEVPVFRVAQAADVAVDDGAAFREAPTAYEPPRDSRVRFNQYARGGPEFYFPPARNIRVVLSLGVFLAIWTGAIWFMIAARAPLLFPIVFGFFEVVLLLVLFSMLFRSSRVTITPQSVTRQYGWLGVHRTRVVPRTEIVGIRLSAGMQAGQHLYHDIKLHRTNGRSITLATALRDKRHAQWLLDKMCDCLSGRP